MNDRIIMHVDANSAFLSWSTVYALQHGGTVDYREIPSIVGGNQATRHGIVLAKSIPAKKYGIQTGEPVVQALRKCPSLVVIPPEYHVYMQCSSAMLEILKDYSDRIQVFSIDEVFLDYTGMEKVLGDPVKVAHHIKDRIKKELGFTVSIGISTNKLLAKMASDLKKPDAVTTLYREEIPFKMWKLNVRDLYMVGAATEAKLMKMGIYTIGDLANTEVEYLRYKFKSWGEVLWCYANGIENSEVKPEGEIPYVKGIGNSCTIHFDVEDRETAHKVLLSLVETVGMRLRHGNFCCRLVQVSIKTNELKSYSHQRKFFVPTDCTNAIYEEACRLFDEAWKGEPIRNLGVRVSELCGNDFVQLSMLEKDYEKQRKIDKAIDGIRMKFGSLSVFRAGFLYSRLSPLQGGIVEDFPVMTSIL
ncbi:DNA polymerase IV [Clostridium thermosuccinogenes]|jgi:DNA polymerase-4|uniref:DNA polymerase IV n=1 Tax=Clostridium thermosuccinogenes TaxID=84032 RepID=A0A2K2F1F9_9CLOT|nr:DNA polymerase IV [Pseudoclostridium thermosuccinogenes]AUS96718.1 DNA polymerase IV [Pseudoclostridium thermosuccinogenes]PNT92621.1 DNA polymerase IV [Pseudoclostridium thermosuccinogenes]PNT97642.1 DNA polymerase IV [Pseudoclostridium thermosuccinogenes]PNU00535.1 DNA polymerase IV [Pseudoclostridium thermosuccinogenes]